MIMVYGFQISRNNEFTKYILLSNGNPKFLLVLFPHTYSLPAVGGLKFIAVAEAFANAPAGSFAKNVCKTFS